MMGVAHFYPPKAAQTPKYPCVTGIRSYGEWQLFGSGNTEQELFYELSRHINTSMILRQLFTMHLLLLQPPPPALMLSDGYYAFRIICHHHHLWLYSPSGPRLPLIRFLNHIVRHTVGLPR
jgi:hypothetical protein